MLSPRPYQIQAAELIKSQNTILNIRTGAGKTLVACMAIDHFLNANEKKIMFIVPTRALVQQQAQCCKNNCVTSVSPAQLCGNEIEFWGRENWTDMMNRTRLLIGTAEIFRRALVDAGFILVEQFSLVIFDECHNATGNSPYAAIMRDAVLQQPEISRPRILGLTASFVNGSMKNIEKKRKALEGLLQVFSPSLPNQQRTEYHQVDWVSENLEGFKPLVEDKLQSILTIFPRYLYKDADKAVKRGWAVFENIGMSGLLFYIREGIVAQLSEHADRLMERESDIVSQRRAQQIKNALQTLSCRLKARADELSIDRELTNLPFVSQKFIALRQLLEMLQRENCSKDFCGLIFVSRVTVTFPLADLLNQHFREVIAQPISGVNSMKDHTRDSHLEQFRLGTLPLLVTTTALEEGIDVSKCSFVIRFDRFDTTKSHIQGSGRARQDGAKIFYFANHIEVEKSKAKNLEVVAMDPNLALNQKDMQEYKTVPKQVDWHPYPRESGAEINFFNALTICYEYCQRAMGQSFEPELELYTIKKEIVCRHPLQFRKIISRVTYPSPDGFVTVSSDEVSALWPENVKVPDIISSERLRNLSSWDCEMRRFMYVVAIQMALKGYIDSFNQPSGRSLTQTKHACSVYYMQNRIKLKNSYKSSSLPAPPKTPYGNVGETNLPFKTDTENVHLALPIQASGEDSTKLVNDEYVATLMEMGFELQPAIVHL